MYKNQFDKDNTKYNAYMFWGECDFLVEQYSLQTAIKLASIEDIRKVYFDEYNFKDCENFLSQSSLFAPSNLLLIKTTKKIAKKEVDNLISICNINPDSFVIFCCVGDGDFKSMTKSFTKNKNACEVVFYNPYDNEAIQILSNIANEYNILIDLDALQYLYTMHQKNLSLCVNDLKKLSIINQPIDTHIVNIQCFGMGAISLDEFFLKLFSGEAIGNDLEHILQEGMNEIALVTQTISFIQQLLNINIYLKLNGNLDIKEIWGYNLPKYIAQKRANVAIRYSIERLNSILKYFLNLELELKTKVNLDINSYTQACFRKISATLR